MGNLTTALRAIDSHEERERERAIPELIASESPEALVALEKVALQDDNLQLRFMAKEGALRLRQRLSGLNKTPGTTPQGELDLNHLKARLVDSDPKRRMRGVRSALATKDRRALPYLNKLLPKESDARVVVELCMTIGVLGAKGDGEALVERLRDPRPEIRVAAIRGLAYLQDKNVYPTLVAMLSDKDKGVRAKAFETLTRLGKPKLVRLLVRMLGSTRSWPRKAAVRACAKINSPEMVDILLKARANDPSQKIRKEAARALVHLARKGNSMASAALAKAPPVELDQPAASTVGLVIDRADQGAPKSPEERRAEVAQARAQAAAGGDTSPSPAPASPGAAASGSSSVSSSLPQPPLELLNLDEDDDPDASELEELELSTAEVMVGGLHDPDPVVRMENLNEILAQKDRSLAQQLAARLPLEDDLKVLTKLILAVGKLGRKKDARRLQTYLTHGEKRLRASAVEALAMLGDEAGLKACIPLLEDEDNRTRANAVVALKDLDGVDVVPVLKEMAKHPDKDMRLSAVYAALEIGTPQIDPVLDYLLKDKEQDVKDKALSALTLLEDQRMAPMRGANVDLDSSRARIEKLSAWRGGEEPDDDDDDSASQDVSGSLDEEAARLIGKLSGDDPSEPESEAEKAQRPAANWGRRPAITVPKTGAEEAQPGFQKWKEDLLEWLSNPSKPPKKSESTGKDVSGRNVFLVVGVTVVVVLLLWLVLGGDGGGDVFSGTEDF